MRTKQMIEDDIAVVRGLIQEAIREHDYAESDALYAELDMLESELYDASTSCI
jgi:hypothetical protein